MTIVDDRLDMEVEEVELPSDEDFSSCFMAGCDAEADWILFYSCGHAFPMCDEHTKGIEQKARMRDAVNQPETCHGVPTRIIRKEPAR